jgi:DeoR/GlpR family transcriptional regulator of sugar metabolism
MLTTHRKRLILDRLRAEGQVIAKSISHELGLSEDTIRRDLRELAQEGLLQRVHGGALPASPAVADFAGRQLFGTAGKNAIGRTAARMIQSGHVVILDGGTTAVHVARHLSPELRATIVTHSPTIAVELVRHPNVEVVILGGRLFKHSVVAVGAALVEAASRIRADIYFMGVTGVHIEAGLSTGDLEEAHVKRALSSRAAETIVLASAEKLNAASPYVIAPLSEVSGIIVEADTPEEIVGDFRRLGIAITRAS